MKRKERPCVSRSVILSFSHVEKRDGFRKIFFLMIIIIIIVAVFSQYEYTVQLMV